MHGISVDEIHDEFFVPVPFAQAILTFRGGADGAEAPIRIIQGPKTQLISPGRLAVDPIHNEIFIPSNKEAILVFRRDANGNVAPIRVIRGPDTHVTGAIGIAVDPVNNLIIVGTSNYKTGGLSGFVIYNRTDNGNVKPLRVIEGPSTGITRIGQLTVYPPGGWIVATQPGTSEEMEPENMFIGVWSIYDEGDVPPKWVIGGPKSRLKKPRGVALNSENKELTVADMRLNAVLTCYFPELFEFKSTNDKTYRLL